MRRTTLLALLLAVSVLAVSCSRAADQQASEDDTAVPSALATNDSLETTTTTESTAGVGRAAIEVVRAETTRASDICPTLGQYFEQRSALRADVLTASDAQNIDRLTEMRATLENLAPPFFPYFDWLDLSGMHDLDEVVPAITSERTAALSGERLEVAEGHAARVEEFAREFCPNIDAGLVNVEPLDDLIEAAQAIRENGRLVRYCAAAGSILSDRYDVLQTLSDGTFDTDGRAAYAAFLSEFETDNLDPANVTAARTIHELGPFLEFASEDDYERELRALLVTVVNTRLALSSPPVPVNLGLGYEMNDFQTEELLGSFEQLCPELPAEHLEHTGVDELGVRSISVTREEWRLPTDDPLLEVCDEMDFILSLYGAATAVVADSDGANEDHWQDIQVFGEVFLERTYGFERPLREGLASNAGQAPSDIGAALYKGESFGAEIDQRVVDDMAEIARLASENCSGFPSELLAPRDDLFEHLEQRIEERQ